MNGNNLCQLAMPCQTINKSLVEFHKDQYLDHFFSYSILMISIILPANLISIYLLMALTFFYAHKSLKELETTVNNELQEVFSWLCANKLSLNIEKSNYVIFRTPQKLVNYSINLMINNQTLTHGNSIKYLGIMIDSHLNWKSQVNYISKKIKRNIGISSKLRHYVNLKTLANLFYSLIYPFLIYGITAWGTLTKQL